jgi:predicted nucleic acid-binding Zn ribbon protein
MPIYRYKTLNSEDREEIFEVEQDINAPPLSTHPLTNEPVQRVLTSVSLSLRHSSMHEKKSLSADHLNKHGFSKYEKDQSSGDYHKTAGKDGPARISSEQIKQSQ